jgi:hypothetical protein
MSGWTTHGGTAVALDRDNIDTDQLIPARFMSTPRSEGYGRFLLHDFRFDADGKLRFPAEPRAGASVLIAGRNFGSGSSREAAVYALVDFGIRVVDRAELRRHLRVQRGQQRPSALRGSEAADAMRLQPIPDARRRSR